MVGNETVDVAEQEVDAGRGAPVSHQAVLNVRTAKVARLAGLLVDKVGAHERVRAKVDLADGQAKADIHLRHYLSQVLHIQSA